MKAEPINPIDYADPTAPATRPVLWIIFCGTLGWVLAGLGVLGVLACGLLEADWYLASYVGLPTGGENRTDRMWVLAGSVAYLIAGIWLLRLHFSKRGAQ